MDRNKAKGMLWGLIVGDAFGSPIQFTLMDNHPWITEMVACPVFSLPPGYWTDDGSMAMCIMDSYVRKGKYDLKDIGDTFVKWFQDGYLSSIEGRSFDVGCATASACQGIGFHKRLKNGHEESQGNGSIMRFAPSYLLAQRRATPRRSCTRSATSRTARPSSGTSATRSRPFSTSTWRGAARTPAPARS